MGILYFTVDAALLEELGERLVGKPYIALAELVKNSYDADALEVTIELIPENDQIIIYDNGHGMNFEEFSTLWMRVGSTHKARQKISRNLGRHLTGSKGVGRLAVQFLAKELTLVTTSEYDLNNQLVAQIIWEKAIRAGDLTKAAVEFEINVNEERFEKGTRIILTGLKHDWNADLIEGLAREIWWLKSPFRSPMTIEKDPKKTFNIEFKSPKKDVVDVFEDQINVIMNIWYAKLVGKNDNGNVTLSLEFAGKEPIIAKYTLDGCKLREGDFEIRIFHLWERQPRGIKVQLARDYLKKFGGVHVYDGGFHLPYYGDPQNDWLGTEVAHSHRLTMSKLLPEELKIQRGLQFLPTISRLFGVVNVDTSKEPDLDILITRDRLQEGEAFQNFVDIVRWGLDFYAYHEKKRRVEKEIIEKKIEKPKLHSIEMILNNYQEEIPKETFSNLRKEIIETTNEIESEAEIKAKQVALMGPLATAGIASIAYQHETERQLITIDDIVTQLGELSEVVADREHRKTLRQLKEDLSLWLNRIRQTSALFNYFQDSENIKNRERYSSRMVLEGIKEQVGPLARDIPIDLSKVEYIRLPEATLVEWSAVFQNVFTNAFNAMLDSEEKIIQVSTMTKGQNRQILVQDTGYGVNLKDADTLFEPFIRKSKISPERQALGYGGTGLGLTIVRLIAENIGCHVSFIEPEKGFSTAFSLSWKESE